MEANGLVDGMIAKVLLRAPFTSIFAGPTGSGKSTCVANLMQRSAEITNFPPVEIIYCYGPWQNQFDNLKIDNLKFHEGLIDVDEKIPLDGQHRWIVLDDLMEEIGNQSETRKLFTKKSHHMNISVLFLVQNLFHPDMRTISINTQYFFMFKNPRDKLGITSLAKQCFPGKTKYVLQCFEKATYKPYSYLMMDLRQETDERFRLIGNFGSLSENMIVYD